MELFDGEVREFVCWFSRVVLLELFGVLDIIISRSTLFHHLKKAFGVRVAKIVRSHRDPEFIVLS